MFSSGGTIMKIYTSDSSKPMTYNINWTDTTAGTYTDSTMDRTVYGDPIYVDKYNKDKSIFGKPVIDPMIGGPKRWTSYDEPIITEEKFEEIANKQITKLTKDGKTVELSLWEWFQLKQMGYDIVSKTFKELKKALVVIKL